MTPGLFTQISPSRLGGSSPPSSGGGGTMRTETPRQGRPTERTLLEVPSRRGGARGHSAPAQDAPGSPEHGGTLLCRLNFLSKAWMVDKGTGRAPPAALF